MNFGVLLKEFNGINNNDNYNNEKYNWILSKNK